MANHLYQSLWLTHEKQGARARAYVTLFSSGGAPALLWLCVSSLRKLCKKIASPKDPFVEPDQYVLTFRHSILVCRGHTLSTAGDGCCYPTGWCICHTYPCLYLTRVVYVWVTSHHLREPWLYDLKGCNL